MNYLGRCIQPSSTTSKEEYFEPFDAWHLRQVDGDPESSAGDAVWRGGLSQDQLWKENLANEERLAQLYSRLEGNAYWPVVETWGERVFLQLVERVSSERDFANWLRLWSTSDPQLLAHAVYAYTRLLDYLCSHHYVMTEDGREAIVHPPEVFHRLIGAERPTIQKAAYDMLVSANEPRDDWHREAVIARILCPRLAMFAVSLPWWLNPPGPGMTEIERQQGTMTAAPDRVERHATRMKREALKLQDWEPARAKPGPKPTSSRRVNPDKQAFDEAMVKKQRQHVSPAMTVEDADVQRLYRAWRGEGAIATEETVRRVLRSQNRVH